MALIEHLRRSGVVGPFLAGLAVLAPLIVILIFRRPATKPPASSRPASP